MPLCHVLPLEKGSRIERDGTILNERRNLFHFLVWIGFPVRGLGVGRF